MQISTANLPPLISSIGIKPVAQDYPTDSAAAGIVLLTRRLAANDEAAFREFHRLYFDRLHQYLVVVARGNQHEAEEALQESMLRVLRYVRPFETEEAFWGWLKVVARSAARDGGRKQRRYLSLLQKLQFTLEGGNGERRVRWRRPPARPAGRMPAGTGTRRARAH